MARRKRAVLIAGPTASGKSALALALARGRGGTVVNADSMQVYRDLRVLTARPTPDEEGLAPHLLYGHVDGAENYSVGRYLADAERAVADLWAAGGLPIVTGGTGLYFKALLEDRKSTRLNSSHANISYAVFCLKKKKNRTNKQDTHKLRTNSNTESTQNNPHGTNDSPTATDNSTGPPIPILTPN